MGDSVANFSERSRLEQGVYDACSKSVEGADLLISAFVAALRSYRRASVCAPFPGFLINNVGEKDFESATKFVRHFPSTQALGLSGYSSDGAPYSIRSIPLQSLKLLHWILRFRYPIQLVKDPGEIPGLLPSKPRGESSKQDAILDRSLLPSHVLKIQEVDEHDGIVNAFQRTKAQHGSIMAFHGTTTESLHSILRCGLLNMSKTHLQRNGALFGEGIYLSTDLGVAAFFCKSGDTWEHSCCGPRVRYVLVCEIARGEGVLCSTHDLQETSDKGAKNPARGHGTYVIVANSDLVRIRYVLVYRDYNRGFVQNHKDTEVARPANQAQSLRDSLKTVWRLDWFSIVILLYIGLLVIAGVSSSGVKGTRFRSSSVSKQLWWFVDRFRVWLYRWTSST